MCECVGRFRTSGRKLTAMKLPDAPTGNGQSNVRLIVREKREEGNNNVRLCRAFRLGSLAFLFVDCTRAISTLH